MSVSVSTRRLRFEFIEMTSGEVGDGTLFPLPVTKEQLEAIMYRVRDAKFTSGEITEIYPTVDGFDTIVTFTFTFQDPPPEFCDCEAEGFTVRSYCTFVEGAVSPDLPMPEYEGPLLGEAYYFSGVYGGSGAGSQYVGARDAEKETGMWAEVTRTNPHDFSGDDVTGYDISGAESLSFFTLDSYSLFVGGGEFRTGFTQHAAWDYFGASHTYLSKYLPLAKADNFYEEGDVEYGYAEMQLIFSGLVAFTNDDGSGNPMSPGNSLFVGLEFDCLSDISPLGNLYSTKETSNSTGASLTFDFGESGIESTSCPLYALIALTGSATDLVITATEWWPYAKDSPAVPVWNTLNGAKI